MALRRVLVAASGEPPELELVRELARTADLVVAVDGGLALLLRAGVVPQLLIGDLDSLDGVAVPPGVEVRRHPREKDATDLELTLDQVAALAPEEIRLVGALGGRVDHLLATCGLLVRHRVPIVVHHRGEVLYAVSGPLTLSGAAPGDRVSLIPLTDRVEGIHTQGLRYPLAGEPLHRTGTRGVSNQVVSLPCQVEFSSGRLLVVHAPAARRPRKKEG